MPGMKVHRHDQTSSSSTWTIVHNFGTKNVVADTMIYHGNPLEIKKAMPLSQVTTDNNTLTITWSSGQTGKATVISYE